MGQEGDVQGQRAADPKLCLDAYHVDSPKAEGGWSSELHILMPRYAKEERAVENIKDAKIRQEGKQWC